MRDPFEFAQFATEQVPLSHAERELFLNDIKHIQSGRGIRALAASDSARLVRKHVPERAELFERVKNALPRYTLFSFMPLGSFITLAAVQAKVFFPDLGLLDAVASMSRLLAADMRDTSVVIRAAWQACDGDIRRYLEFIIGTNQQLTNFGRVHCDPVSARRAVLRFEEHELAYPRYCGNAAFLEGILTSFGLDGEVNIVVVDSQNFEFDVSWEA